MKVADCCSLESLAPPGYGDTISDGDAKADVLKIIKARENDIGSNFLRPVTMALNFIV